jgi:hypothetical protein
MQISRSPRMEGPEIGCHIEAGTGVFMSNKDGRR